MKLARPIRVLVAEDEAHLGELLRRFLTGRGHRVTLAADGRAALDALEASPFDVALLDAVMPQLDGLEVLRRVREHPAPPECIIIAGSGTIDTAIGAMTLGAYDYVSKPYRLAEIEALVRRAWEKRQLTRENEHLSARLSCVDVARDFTSVYAPMQAVLAVARRAAAGDGAVLITGEPGSGKSELARYVHSHSRQGGGPLLHAACAQLAAGGAAGAAATLYGVEPRAAGLMESAAGGTLVLDDVDRLDPDSQATLAHLLTTGSFRRMGSRHVIEAEARVIATMQLESTAAFRTGALRAELRDALGRTVLSLPPLRERAVDIGPLAAAFVGESAGGRGVVLGSDAVEALQSYTWPGNLRELRSVLERAVLLARDGTVHAGDLTLPASTRGSAVAAPLTLAEVERLHIEAILRAANWHQGKAARFLGISAKTLYRKIRAYGFQRPAAARPS